MLSVACVYKPGGGFTAEYVYRLRDSLALFCDAQYRFVCLTNESLPGIDTIPLAESRPGFWNKLELFKLPGPVVYLDLDTLIVSDVTDVLTYPHEFTTGTNWKHGRAMASWFLAWGASQNLRYLNREFRTSDIPHYQQCGARWGDQGYIEDHFVGVSQRIDDLFPGRALSYKYHVKPAGHVPKRASFVVFHGKPRPHQIGWKLP